LYLSLVAEVPCDENDAATKAAFEETESILNFGPDRLGHALLLPPTLQKKLSDLKIAVESCPTSNVMTLELAKHYSGSLLEGLKTHPQLATWLDTKHPISIGTDDPGVFHTTATKELLLLQKAFGLKKDDLKRVALDSMHQAFCDDATKRAVLERMEARMLELSK
jgi:adenosine deaminase